MYRAEALQGIESLEVFRTEAGELDWTFVSPAEAIGPGERTGTFRVGGDELIVDGDGKSFISYEDFAVALVDELEQGRQRRRRFTVGY